MDLSPVKREILETILLHDKPVKATQVATEIGKEFPSVMMHLLGLKRMGYIQSPEKGYYLITVEGKKALGILQLDEASAKALLAPLARDKVFHFYYDIGKPLNLHAQSLQDFCEKISKANVNAVEFHVNRGDFEAWFKGIGDLELAKKTALLKNKKFSGEELRLMLSEIAENRCKELIKMAEPNLA